MYVYSLYMHLYVCIIIHANTDEGKKVNVSKEEKKKKLETVGQIKRDGLRAIIPLEHVKISLE